MQTIYLDISNKSVVPTIYAKQGDVGRKFDVVLTDSGLAYNIPIGSAFSVFYSGSSGEGNYTEIDDNSAFSVYENKVTVEIITQALTNDGNGVLCLVLIESNGKQIGSWNIPYVCEGIPGFDSEAAKAYYTAFSKAVERLNAATENLTPQSVGAAPAGYGLGVNTAQLTNIMDCDTAKSNGWYLVHKSANNSPFPNSHCAMRVDSHTNEQIVQTAYCGTYTSAGFIIKQRFLWNNSWEEWEFINPPMLPGVEYRTTERYNGKAVYTKLVELGNLPNKGTKDVQFTDDTRNVFPISLETQFGAGVAKLHVIKIDDVFTSLTNYHYVRMVTTSDRSKMVGRAIVKYYYT